MTRQPNYTDRFNNSGNLSGAQRTVFNSNEYQDMTQNQKSHSSRSYKREQNVSFIESTDREFYEYFQSANTTTATTIGSERDAEDRTKPNTQLAVVQRICQKQKTQIETKRAFNNAQLSFENLNLS